MSYIIRLKSISINQIEFPASWNTPHIPAYGTFPWPFVNRDDDFPGKTPADKEGIAHALSSGYRHIDTAFTYGNQNLIGKAVSDAAISRKDIHVTSKLHPYNNFYHDAKLKIKEAVHLIWGAETENSYLDCFMIHYPGVGRPLSAWKAIEEARECGLIKHAGVSNFEIRHLEVIKNATGEFPEVNQIEFHPWIYSRQAELVEYCHINNIAIEGYSPLAQGKDLKNPVIAAIAEHHKTTPARIILKWCIQHGAKPVVGSRNQENIKMNAMPYDFILSENDMRNIDNICTDNIIRVSEQWNWNPSKSGFGGSVPGQNPVKKFLKKIHNLASE